MTDVAERELSNTLEDRHGFAAMPAGGSGSGTDRARPDVWAARRATPTSAGGQLVIEVKRRASDWPQAVHLQSDEVHALQSFASRAGAQPYIALRPHRGRSDQNWHLFHARDLHETPEHYSIRQDDLPGLTLAEVVAAGDD